MSIFAEINCSTGEITERQPTTEELLDAAERGHTPTEELKKRAIIEINRTVNNKVIELNILTNELFFIANIADIGLLVGEWRSDGRPEEPDPQRYYRAYQEARAYAETSDPGMTAFKMLSIWEAQWNWMRNSFADLNYSRRKALERVKMAINESQISDALADLVIGSK
jgi:hypothetical protein